MNIQQFLPDKLDAIYGALVGGGLAVIVSVLSNRHSLKRLRLELSHQAQQKEIERKLELKRDIYIPLMDAASNALSYYGRIGTVPSELIRNPEPLNLLNRQISKMSVVASKEVMEAVNTAQADLTVGAIKLFKERMAIEQIIGQLSNIESQINFFESQGESLNKRFEKHVDAGTGTGLVDVLIRLMNEQQQAVQKLYAQKTDLLLQKSAIELNISRQSIKDIATMSVQHRAVLVAIRQDLDLPIDEPWLTQMADRNTKNVVGAIDNFHKDVEKILADIKPVNSEK